MRLLVCGSRNFTDKETIAERMRWMLNPGDVVIHGGARGADSIAGEVAAKMGLEVIVYKANWERDGRSAGPIRNDLMLKDGKPDAVLAFFNPGTSRGTQDMVSRARRAGVPVLLGMSTRVRQPSGSR